MIGLGLRLGVSGGREAITRLVILAIAVGLGTGLLLTAVAATNAVTTWNNRHGWFWTGTTSVPAAPAAAGTAPLWWHPSSDIFNGQTVNRFDVAATGASSPVPPGIPRDPGPGQYYASPALAALLRSTPANQLAARYPGRLAGTIGDAALPSPDSLVIIVGRTPAQLAHTPQTVQVTSIATTVPGNAAGPGCLGPACPPVQRSGLSYQPPNGGAPASASDLILAVVALAILAPVLIFIATATRLSAARREQRFAAMRLVGATRKQVSLLAATESTAAAVLGAAVGFGIFLLLRVPVAGIPFIGEPFFPAELSLSLADILLVAIGVPLAAAIAARLALRRVQISPLGVARRQTPKPPRAWRTAPLLAGLAELAFWTVHGHPASISGQIQAFASSFALILIGLFIAGPWITMAAASAMARWTSRPGTLIAARRLADDPGAAFRAVSGLVLALFITTVAVVAITTQNAKNLTRWGTVAEANVLTDQLTGKQPGSVSQGSAGPAAPIAPLVARLQGIHGVQGVVVVRADRQLTIPGRLFSNPTFGSQGPVPAGLVSCAQLATVPALGRCPAGATAVAFPEYGFSIDEPSLFGANATGITWPAANISASRLATLGVAGINVGTDGATAAVEQARTVLENATAYPAASTPSTVGDLIRKDNSKNTDYQQLANVVILVSLPIAGCTLAAGIAGGLADRKRPFSLLRLTGARLATLRHVVALEGAVPLLSVAAVAIGIGFAGAAMFASEAQQHPMVAPGAAYYLLTAGGIVISLGIIAATFPLLARITGPEVARND
ncbi:MAG TPA: FtsX-like permease family protein [Streptosporangiaceae bacterium]|nr:FtsX-like permease family protein [Streptosporangiaceae bacterium]